MKNIFLTLLILVIAGGGAAYYSTHKPAVAPTTKLRTEPIKRGDLISSISATGTVEPEEVVNVGAQVNGLIIAFGDDPKSPSQYTDYCSVVEKGAVLARLDPTFYQGQLEKAEAVLQQSRANQMQLEARAKKAERDMKRAETLKPKKAIASSDYDTVVSDYEASKANVATGLAMIRQNEAEVKTAQVNVNYCTIKSPVRGNIIDRRVNIGQTVVASFNAPSLFLIAKDLTRMQIWASVNEADIGRIRLHMPVHFTVDAYPGEKFQADVIQIRMNARMEQNVVTYTVIAATNNTSGKLMPYMTASVHFEVDQRTNVLLVSNAALRWVPEADQVDPSVDKSILSEESTDSKEPSRIWIVGPNGLARPLNVKVGMTDGTSTEISGTGVQEGLQVVVSEESPEGQEGSDASDGGDKASNPFLPKLPKGAKPPPGPM